MREGGVRDDMTRSSHDVSCAAEGVHGAADCCREGAGRDY